MTVISFNLDLGRPDIRLKDVRLDMFEGERSCCEVLQTNPIRGGGGRRCESVSEQRARARAAPAAQGCQTTALGYGPRSIQRIKEVGRL